jgi:hypothetical protein
MNYNPVPFIQGVDVDNPARMIPENKASSVENIIFKDLRVMSR